ncbi:hypothetical protein IFR04_003869 [Cadophora malorum]|uniref:Uncharacterized protein n=1 Tax=Cadophora malorum TaxID=108018 RepID=A0A8H7WDR1_9HELO|nr:hypothetical protein IFR04_003869 [Cadophora malorum]
MLLISTLVLSLLPLVATRAVSPLPALAELLPVPGISLDVNLHLSQNTTVAYHRLGKRALSQTSITKGRRLDCMMSATIAHAQQINGGVRVEENFDEYLSLLLDEGWEQQTIDPKYSSSGIQANLQTLTGADPDNTEYVYFLSKESGEIDGQPISPTGAFFGNGINPQGGVIIADNNKTPRYALGQVPFFPISRIVQWSQAAFGEWEYQAGAVDDQVVEALRGVGRTSIPGIASRQVFRRTSTNQAEVDGFYAMLGTPNGASTGFLLATHKGKLGIKRVASIAVWNHPLSDVDLNSWRDGWKLNMLFTLEPVANPTTGNPQKA